MKSKIKVVIIIIAIIMVGVIIGSVVFYATNKIQNTEFDIHKEYDRTITKVKKINESIKNVDNLSSDSSYIHPNGNTCKKYIGDNFEELVQMIKEVYVEPFNNSLYFDLYEELYICLPDKCVIEEILEYNIEETNEGSKSNIKTTSMYKVNYLEKSEGKLKFKYPQLFCN